MHPQEDLPAAEEVRVDQNQHQQLKVWQDKCGQMVMGPKCLDCPLALKQNPRPGRPNVIETENWLDAKRKMHWDDMKATKPAPPIVRPTRHDPPNPRDIAEKMTDNGILEEESETPPSTVPDKVALSEPEVTEEEEAPSLLDALENPDDYIEEESTEEEPVEEEPETPAVDDDDFLSSLADD